MNNKLLKSILHTADYNSGGIAHISLLDIDAFKNYRFRDNGLYSNALVDEIMKSEMDYISMATVDETAFTESFSNGIYQQELKSFVGTVDAEKTAELLHLQEKRFLVLFAGNGRLFTFGSDGGATLTFSQQSGQMGQTSGYNITLLKSSIYPLFEVDMSSQASAERKFNEMFNQKFN